MKGSSAYKLVGFLIIVGGFILAPVLSVSGGPTMQAGGFFFVGLLGFIAGLGIFMIGRRIEYDDAYQQKRAEYKERENRHRELLSALKGHEREPI